MLVHQHDTIGPFERSTRRANVHAGRLSAMLAHHWQRLTGAGFGVGDIDFPDPLGIGGFPAMPLQTIFPAASADAVVTTVITTVEVDQHSPTYIAGYGTARGPCCG